MARNPKQIGSVLSELMARRGFTWVRSAEAYGAAWQEAAGPLAAKYTRVGSLRRGTLEVVAANSTLVQELGYQKPAILKTLARLLPDAGIKNVRFRIGPIE